jgi:16S rRNA U1498 N3-methylase RsmE
MEAMEQTRTIEITQSQYQHLKEVMAMDKPSRTRLTQQEKSMIRHMCSNFSQMFSIDTEQEQLLQSILKKLK